MHTHCFCAKCFADTGATKTEYAVCQPSTKSGPIIFSSLDRANKYAVKTGREVMIRTIPVRARVGNCFAQGGAK